MHVIFFVNTLTEPHANVVSLVLVLVLFMLALISLLSFSNTHTYNIVNYFKIYCIFLGVKHKCICICMHISIHKQAAIKKY